MSAIPLHPIPKPPPDQDAILPDDALCYLAGKNGLFKQVKNEFYSVRVKTDGVGGLAEINEHIQLFVPLFPLELFKRVEAFFTEVYRRHESEAVVLLFCNPQLRQWRVCVPPQKVQGLRVHYDPCIVQNAPGFELFGTIHSHAGISAFHSGTDDRDEIHFDGLHATIGDLNKPIRTYACRWMLAGKSIKADLGDVLEWQLPCDVDPHWLSQVSYDSQELSIPRTRYSDCDYFELECWSEFYGKEFSSREKYEEFLYGLHAEIEERLEECQSLFEQ